MVRTSGYSKKNDETPIVTKIKISEESAPPKYIVTKETMQVQSTVKEDNDGFYMAVGGFSLLLLLLGWRKDKGLNKT